MSTLLLYLLKLSLSLGVMYAFYRLVLQRFTFYRHNRWYLLLYSMVSFFIPLIDLAELWSPSSPRLQQVKEWVPAVTQYAPAAEAGPSAWIIWLLVAVSTCLLARTLIRLWSLQQLRQKASLLREGNVKVYQVSEAIAPFSFGNAIYINQHQHTPAELENILRHELVHVRERHTIDMLWAEFLCLINWYNPAAWLIRKAIRQNLEFIADNRVLETGVNKKEYQYLLLQVMGRKSVPAGISFNVSSLKKRIAMMNKNKTARAHLSWFLLLLPVASIVLLSFRSNWPPAKKTIVIVPTTPVTDTVPRVREVRLEKKSPGQPARAAAPAKKAKVAKTETIEIVPAEPKLETVAIEPVKDKNKAPKEKNKIKNKEKEKVKEIEIIEAPVKPSKAAAQPTQQQWKKAELYAKNDKRVEVTSLNVKKTYTGKMAYSDGKVTVVSDSITVVNAGEPRNGKVEMRADNFQMVPMERKSKEAPAPRLRLK